MKINNKIKKNRGTLLFELLITISLLAIILSFSANATFLSLVSNKTSRNSDILNSLASGTLEAVRSIAGEDWQYIYTLPKNNSHYYPGEYLGKWEFFPGDNTINLNDIIYTRYIVINNVSRDDNTRDIEDVYNAINDDPSTQKVTVTVSYGTNNSIVMSEYFFRWKNKICNQNGWVTGGSGDVVKLCINTDYDTKDMNIDLTGGTIKLQ